MRIYVCGKYEDKRRISRVMWDLENTGHTISYNWTKEERPPKDQAIIEIDAVLDSEALVCVFERDLDYAGSLVEFGVALGAGLPIYVIGNAPICNRLLFMNHPLVHRGTGGLYASKQGGV